MQLYATALRHLDSSSRRGWDEGPFGALKLSRRRCGLARNEGETQANLSLRPRPSFRSREKEGGGVEAARFLFLSQTQSLPFAIGRRRCAKSMGQRNILGFVCYCPGVVGSRSGD